MPPDTAIATIPVTVLTGYLGSGKTTLLNHLLTSQHGKRIAVIENEFGEIGIDNHLVINADEEVFEMNNGCICCTVRGDLIRILGNLMRRRDRFDYILVETTGMADPGPVAQTFFVDSDMKERFRLDGIVTVVDAKHVWLHIDDSDEVREQIAFADVIMLNKCDLVPAGEIDRLENRIRSMNAIARIERTVNSVIDPEKLLDIGAFDLDRTLAAKPTFLDPEYPFEWGGIIDLPAGEVIFDLEDGPDPSMSLALVAAGGETTVELKRAAEQAALIFAADEVPVINGEFLTPGATHWRLELAGNSRKQFKILINRTGKYALFTEHGPEEFNLRLFHAGNELTALVAQPFSAHEHDDEVSSVGITLPGEVDPQRLNAWLGPLLQEQGKDIFRMKGILAIKGEDRRYVFQGVHMLFDGKADRPWRADEPRGNQMVFIGRNLLRAQLVSGFNACLA